MKVYVDVLLVINFIYDFLVLLCTSILLKRNIRVLKIILGAFFGSLSLFVLIIPFSFIGLFIFKFLLAFLMVLISFGFKNIRYIFINIVYLYLVSIILGGFLYYINNSLSLKNTGLLFVKNNVKLNLYIGILLAPICLYFYIKGTNKLNVEYSKKYLVKLVLLDNKELNITGFLDTGNNLTDPYFNKPIIMINKDLIDINLYKYILVPCTTVNSSSLIKCIKIKKIYINNKLVKKDCLVGISDNYFNIDGVDLLLNKLIMKG